ncbi:hypothetical protein BDV30DRAFT_167738 [Aspergillus minisclerotigenes]|uniref:Uncharacterized protein n=1 Tax=Aspergillus minisclerotigenes TaxID=656917 RepID=A0A5N6IVE3_9EURO|nr:hypothetical protein BDV30DRAFT_167738 [Aspergillus minisclerotigenes]
MWPLPAIFILKLSFTSPPSSVQYPSGELKSSHAALTLIEIQAKIPSEESFPKVYIFHEGVGRVSLSLENAIRRVLSQFLGVRFARCVKGPGRRRSARRARSGCCISPRWYRLGGFLSHWRCETTTGSLKVREQV